MEKSELDALITAIITAGIVSSISGGVAPENVAQFYWRTDKALQASKITGQHAAPPKPQVRAADC